MKFGVPWSVKGIRREARETAREAARRSGMSLGDWLNTVILNQAEESGLHESDVDDDGDSDDISGVHQRLDELARRLDHVSRAGPAAYAPKRHRDNEQLAEMISRLDRRLDQFVSNSRPMSPQYVMPQYAPPVMPSVAPVMPSVPPLPPALDLAISEIAARQRALNGQPPLPTPPRPRVASPPLAPAMTPQAAAPPAVPPQYERPPIPPIPSVLAPAPMQDISGLEDQLRRITDQIETLRRPGVEEAINALRDELGDIGRRLNDAMPRRAIETIERQVAGLTQRIAEGRQAGIDSSALSGVEQGLAEVRDALRGLTPAENLVGFNDAVTALAHKIDQIVAQKDPATFQQLDHSINALRDMAAHVASNEAIGQISDQLQQLSDKVDYLASTGGAGGALNDLEQRITALADALEKRAQNGGAVPPMLDSLVHSLTEKIELIQQSRGDDTLALGHLEDRIVNLVERLDASDSRLVHLEAIERGLADLLVHIEDLRANKDTGGLRAASSPEVDALKSDLTRTQSAIEQVHSTLGHVVDRLANIEQSVRGAAPARPRPISDEEFAEITQPVGKVAVRVVVDAPPVAPAAPAQAQPAPAAAPAPPSPRPAASAPAPRRLPPAGQLPINPDLPPDEPLEPGSGPPPMRANQGIRIADARPGAASPAGKSGFIAAARRAAQAAAQTVTQAPIDRVSLPEADDPEDGNRPSLRDRIMKKVKTLFIAASVIAIVVGTVQIVGRHYDLGNFDRTGTKTAKVIEPPQAATADPVEILSAPPTVAARPPEPPTTEQPAPPSEAPLVPPASTAATLTPPQVTNTTTAPLTLPSLLNPPLLSPAPDVTGSIPSPTVSRPARPAAPPQLANGGNGELPTTIGGPRLRNAAMAGDAAAAFEIGVRYAEGRGVPVSLDEAARWYEKAANKGLAPAQFRYASLLEKGQGVRKDLAQARRLYLAAAGKGNAKAMHNLAVLYAEGVDGKPDYGTAVIWFRKAAQYGIADSQYNLGVLCARGLGTAQSFDESYKWFALAAAQGDRDAARKRDDIASRLDAGALAAAQLEVKTFAATPQPDEATIVAEPPGGWDRAATAPTTAPRGRPGAPLSLGALDMGSR